MKKSLTMKDRPSGSRLLPGTALAARQKRLARDGRGGGIGAGANDTMDFGDFVPETPSRAARQKRLASDGRGGGISVCAHDTMDCGDIFPETPSPAPKEPAPKDASPKDAVPGDAATKDAAKSTERKAELQDATIQDAAPKEAAPKDASESTERNAAADKQHEHMVQQLEEQVAGGMARRAALAENTQTEERAKTQELERTLELLCQQEEELNQRLLSASTAVATALEKTPAAADQVLPCLGDAYKKCLHGSSFVWTVKQQEDHVRSFGLDRPAAPPAASGGKTASSGRK
jgi:hypothetical protein